MPGQQLPDLQRMQDKSRSIIGAGEPHRHVWLADWREAKLPHCTLYLISPDNDWPCKVGVSTSARKRLTALQTSVWRPIKVDYSVWCRTVAEAKALEKALHATLTEDGKWMHGEWFDMRPNDAIDLISFKAMVMGIECFDVLHDEAMIERARSFIHYYADTTMLDRVSKYGDRPLASLAK